MVFGPSALEWGVTVNGLRHGNPALKGAVAIYALTCAFVVGAHVGPRFRGNGQRERWRFSPLEREDPVFALY